MFSFMGNIRLPFCLAIVLAMILSAGLVPAAALEPVTYPEPPDSIAFSIQKNGETIPVTLRQIEQLGLFSVTTGSPFEEGQLTFQGVLFRDVMRMTGLDSENSVTIRAEDDYVQIIPQEDWTEGPLLLATRQDGRLLTRRMQGPTRLVYPLNDYPAFDTPIHKPRWIWLIKTIEVDN